MIYVDPKVPNPFQVRKCDLDHKVPNPFGLVASFYRVDGHLVDYSLLTDIWLLPPLMPNYLPILPDSHLTKQNRAEKAISQ